jgi:hypothetical protein
MVTVVNYSLCIHIQVRIHRIICTHPHIINICISADTFKCRYICYIRITLSNQYLLHRYLYWKFWDPTVVCRIAKVSQYIVISLKTKKKNPSNIMRKIRGVNYWFDLNPIRSDPIWLENKWVGYKFNFFYLNRVRINLTQLIIFLN